MMLHTSENWKQEKLEDDGILVEARNFDNVGKVFRSKVGPSLLTIQILLLSRIWLDRSFSDFISHSLHCWHFSVYIIEKCSLIFPMFSVQPLSFVHWSRIQQMNHNSALTLLLFLVLVSNWLSAVAPHLLSSFVFFPLLFSLPVQFH